jgi:hypothetical protein
MGNLCSIVRKFSFLSMIIACVLSRSAVTTAWASERTPLPNHLPPHIIAKPAIVQPLPSVPADLPPLTKETVERLTISPWLHDRLLRGIHQNAFSAARKLEAAEFDINLVDRPYGSTGVGRTGFDRFHAKPSLAVIEPATRLTNDQPFDQEPTIIANEYCIGPTCETRVVGAYMRYPTSSYNANPLLYVTRTSDYASMQLPAPNLTGDGLTTADPVLAEDGWGGMMYVVGVAYTSGQSGQSALAVWKSTDGWKNNAFGSPTVVPANPYSFYPFVLDKPSATVSMAGATYRDLYVVAALVDTSSVNRSPTTFHFYRSQNEGSFSEGQTISAGTTVSSFCPEVVVDSLYGDVYVLWLDYALSTDGKASMFCVHSTDIGTTWSAPVRLAAPAEFLGPLSQNVCPHGANSPAVGACVGGRTLIDAKFNNASRSIGVTFSAREGGQNSDPDVWFASFNVSTQQWNAPANITPQTGSAQWLPTIDYDNYGNYEIQYYDRSGDVTGDMLYNVKIRKVSPAGNVLDENTLLPVLADPRQTTGTDTLTFRFGDYQGLWTYNGLVYSTFFWSRNVDTVTRFGDVGWSEFGLP